MLEHSYELNLGLPYTNFVVNSQDLIHKEFSYKYSKDEMLQRSKVSPRY